MTTPESGVNQQAGGNRAGERNVPAVAALTLGLTGVLAFVLFRPLAFIPAIAGVVIGVIGLKSSNQRWMAIVGIALSILVLLAVFGLLKALLS